MDRKSKEIFLQLGQEIARLLTVFLNETMTDERGLALYEDDLYRPEGKKFVMYSIVLKYCGDLAASIIRTVELTNPDIDGEDVKEQFIEAFLDSLRIARENVKDEDIVEYKKFLQENINVSESNDDDNNDDDGPKGMLH